MSVDSIRLDQENNRSLNYVRSVSTKTRVSSNRQFGDHVRAGIQHGGAGAQAALGTIAPFVPGAAIVSTAIDRVLAKANAHLGSAEGNFLPASDMSFDGPAMHQTTNAMGGEMSGGAGSDIPSSSMRLLKMQERMQYRLQNFLMMTNMAKAEHDAKMGAIRNLR